ncbi:MAG TPA: septum formation family protein [Candidatus Limnocylindrales bacterium]|jgi:hypothetical protein|nr:septum formation family protein [Candidatus Limnocylindrales bacterium]
MADRPPDDSMPAPPPPMWPTAQQPWQPPPGWKNPDRGPGKVIAIVVVVALVVFVGLGLVGGLLAYAMSGLAGRTPIEQVPVGACFDGIGPTATGGDSSSVLALFFGVSLVDCAEPHDAELVGRFDWSGPTTDFPGEPALASHSESGCRERFREYVGRDFDLSVYELVYTYPPEPQWRSGKRSFECIVHLPAGQLEGSVHHSQR